MARKCKKSQPVTLKPVVHTIKAMLPHTQAEGGCKCTHKSHRRGRGHRTCGAPTPGRSNDICARCEKGHVEHYHHDDAPVHLKQQRIRNH